MTERLAGGDGPAAMAQELAALRAENARLLRLLRLTRTQAAPPGPAQAGFFEAPPGPVHAGSPPATKVALFGALFAARNDVHAVRWENVRTGKAGWLPAVRGGWRKGTPHAERVNHREGRAWQANLGQSRGHGSRGQSQARKTAPAAENSTAPQPQ